MSNQPRSSSGGVRNLRAMFEQKDESSTSPPDIRGRSPAGSYGAGSNGTSPRPLSKVRTSFVTVERSGQFGGQLGLRISNEADQSLAKRRTSFSIDEETDAMATAGRKQMMNSELDARKKSAVVTETVPESAILDTPPIESVKMTGYMNGNGSKAATAVTKTNGNADKKATPVAVVTGNLPDTLKPTSPTKSTSRATSAKTTAKPSPISIAKASATPKQSASTTRSPAMPKTPTTPAKTPTTPGKARKVVAPRAAVPPKSTEHKSPERRAVKPAVSSAASKLATRSPVSSSANTNVTKKTAPVASATGFIKPRPKSPTKPAKLPASLTTHTASSQSKVASGSPPAPRRQSRAPSDEPAPVPSATGFIKPRPKSPTKPAKLPASLTTHTASSQSKVASGSPPPRRASLAPNDATKAGQKPASRSPSRVSLAPKAELRRTKSSIHTDRPALGRPSASTLRNQTSRQSLPKQAAPVADEGFLARMMRPTTSSASKVLDKQFAPSTENAKSTTRPQTRDSMASHAHEDLKDGLPIQKLPVVPKLPKVEAPEVNKVESEGPATTAKAEAMVIDGSGCSGDAENVAPTISKPIVEEDTSIDGSPVAKDEKPIPLEESALPDDNASKVLDPVVEEASASDHTTSAADSKAESEETPKTEEEKEPKGETFLTKTPSQAGSSKSAELVIENASVSETVPAEFDSKATSIETPQSMEDK